jgi:putative peptide zinc metalloprotease protein
MLLPPLREELKLHAAPGAANGSPSWTLQDPARNRFFRIDWPTFLILSHWNLRQPALIAAAASTEAPIDMSEADVEAVRHFLDHAELLQTAMPTDTQRLLKTLEGERRTPATWLLHHYLFFRVPLLRPDAWLSALLPYLRFVFTRSFAAVTLFALAAGLLGVLRQWDVFSATLLDTLSWSGAAAYAVALIGVKVLHELGHAVAAKRRGCRVPTMGIAFLVMWPVAYTDVNEAWKLASRRDRLAVGAAGIATELVLAAWASLAWTLLPDGPARNAAFLLATTTWVTTLLINASPFLRFDGYFLLSDAWDMPNLHQRAFALARWHLREMLFRLGEPPPESFAPRRRAALVLFAWATWAYRAVVFFGIALLVYHVFFKALGLLLFAVEIAWFILLPIQREIREWRKRLDRIGAGGRWRRGAALLALTAAILFVPWDTQVAAVAILKPAQTYAAYAPAAAQLQTRPVATGSLVQAGTPLFVLDSPDLTHRREVAQARLAGIEARIAAANVDDALRAQLPVLVQERRTLLLQQQALAEEAARLAPAAPFTGRMADVPPNLQPGDWIGRQTRLATLFDPSRWQAEAWLDERDIDRIRSGQRARFYPDTPGLPVLDLTVEHIDRDAVHAISEPMLASVHGGSLLVRTQGEQLIPERASYRVRLAASTAPTGTSVQRGQVVIDGRARTLFGHYGETALAALIRESAW